jgi:hypothetical protein
MRIMALWRRCRPGQDLPTDDGMKYFGGLLRILGVRT